MSDLDDAILFALHEICSHIDYDCLAAQEAGRALAEHHRRAQAQRFRALRRELSAKVEKVGSGGKSSLPSIHGDEIANSVVSKA